MATAVYNWHELASALRAVPGICRVLGWTHAQHEPSPSQKDDRGRGSTRVWSCEPDLGCPCSQTMVPSPTVASDPSSEAWALGDPSSERTPTSAHAIHPPFETRSSLSSKPSHKSKLPCIGLLKAATHVRLFQLPNLTLAWCGAGKTGSSTVNAMLSRAALKYVST